MLNPASPLAELLVARMRAGRVVWIGLRPERGAELLPVGSATLDPIDGLAGDHYRSSGQRKRQVTLIQAEHLAAIGAFLGRDAVDAALLRRNVVVTGINLLALQGRPFRLGGAVLEATGACPPCSRMEAALGPGGYNAMRGHGGITARIVTGGTVMLDDPVMREPGA